MSDIKHVYELIFTEHDVDLFSIDNFLDDFEKLCLRYDVKFDHVSCHLLERNL